jgi:hypothetical protein
MSRPSTRGLARRLDRAAARAAARRAQAPRRSILEMNEAELRALAKTMTRAQYDKLTDAERDCFHGIRVAGRTVADIGIFYGPGHPGITQREFLAAIGFRPRRGDIVIAFWNLPRCWRLRKGPGAPDRRPETDDELLWELNPAYPAPTLENPDPDPYPLPPLAPAPAALPAPDANTALPAPRTEPQRFTADDFGTPDTAPWA